MRTKAPDRRLKAILEIGKLITGRHDLHRVLRGIVSKVAEVMGTDVASLYLLDNVRGELVLSATKGLSPESVGRVRMKVSEGLTGFAVERMRPVAVVDPSRHPRYKYFPGTREEQFHSFMAVPLIDKHRPVGAIVVQTRKARDFTNDEVNLLSAIATQVVGVVENARLLGHIERIQQEEARPSRKPDPRRTTLLHGTGAGSGIAIGRAAILHHGARVIAEDKGAVDPALEKRRLLRALRGAERETAETIKRASQHFSREEIAIFDAYELILKDPTFRQRVIELIDRGLRARAALERVTGEYTQALSRAEAFYLRERAFDVEDVGHRILEHLAGGRRRVERARGASGPEILIAQTLGVYDILDLDRKHVQGIVVATGGAYSHVAILARAMGLPLVLGVEGLLEHVRPGDRLVVDGVAGFVHVNPQEEVETEYRRARTSVQAARRTAAEELHLEPRTIDGVRIRVGANVGMLANVREAVSMGIDEIGLYRTEFPFLIRSTTPTEEEQYNLYRKVIELMGDKPVTFRTLDVGGDKTLANMGFPAQENPILGWRSIRVSLDREDLFKIQLRAIYRAARHGVAALLFPMITRIEEIRRVKEVLADVMGELTEENVPFRADVPIGAMIEVPAAAELARKLAREVDFFSIGSNDLVQYTLAVDRNNEKVSPLYDPLHPAVLAQIHRVVEGAAGHRRAVGVCGEMAGDPVCAATLLALGVRRLSMGIEAIPRIKKLIREVRMDRLEELRPQLLDLDTGSEIRKMISEVIPQPG